MSRKNRNYTPEFIRESVTYAISAPNVSEAAKELGIAKSTLHTWIRAAKRQGEAEIDSDKRVNIGEVINELQALKKKVAVLEQEKAILKKAATYFAKELG